MKARLVCDDLLDKAKVALDNHGRTIVRASVRWTEHGRSVTLEFEPMFVIPTRYGSVGHDRLTFKLLPTFVNQVNAWAAAERRDAAP